MQPTPDLRRWANLPNFHFHDYAPETDLAAEVLDGLAQPQKRIPFRFLYDEMGSRLFARICQQPEYYPTRTEIQILETNAAEIAALAGPGAQLVELGSGAGRKVDILLDAMDAPAAYIAVDISRDALLPAATRLAARRLGLSVHAVCADFSEPFDLPLEGEGQPVGFFPGSSIGNFSRAEASRFLGQWGRRLGPGAGMIVGVDIIKPIPLLEAAYNDDAGVTADFTLNILRRANRELRADFRLADFRHEAVYDPRSAAIEIFLVSQKDQTASVCGRRYSFSRGERVHVESSHKYDVEGFASLAAAAGFDHVGVWIDPDRLFSVHYLKVAG